MIFINLGKFRKKPDKATAGDTVRMMEEFKGKGIKVLNWYWTLGRYERARFDETSFPAIHGHTEKEFKPVQPSKPDSKPLLNSTAYTFQNA